eukprot:scaffold45501_cov61-Attheya_sp.AAC.1
MHQWIAYFKHYTAVCLTQNDPKKGGAGFRPDQSYIMLQRGDCGSGRVFIIKCGGVAIDVHGDDVAGPITTQDYSGEALQSSLEPCGVACVLVGHGQLTRDHESNVFARRRKW